MKRVMFFCTILLLCVACSETSDNEASQQEVGMSESEQQAIEAEETSENFYVMAMSGLKLRAKPNGERLATIPYGAAVERVGTQTFGALEVEEIKGLKVKGEWVKARYEGKEGYIFNSFLTKHKMPEQVDEYDYEKYYSMVDYYLRTSYKKDGDKYDVEKSKDCEEDNSVYCYQKYSQDFENGTIKYKSRSMDSGSEETLTFQNMSLVEAYFIVKAMDLNGANKPEYKGQETIMYNKSKNMILFEADGAGCYSDIKEKGDAAEITISCGC